MKLSKIIAWIALIAFVVIQFFPVNYNQSETFPQTDFIIVNKVPEAVKKSLKVSCYDCHSNNTDYPWYNKVQPVAWYLENHIAEGKAELNFNEWADYSDRRKKSKLRSIVNQIINDEMPMGSYTLMHKGAELSPKDKTLINEYMKMLKDSLE